MKYFKVRCKFGHCGSGYYRDITFYIKAMTAYDAMMYAKQMPGVKHNNPGAVGSLVTITKEEYIKGRKESAYKNFKKEV